MKKNILIVEYDNQTIDKIRDILSAPVFELTIAEAGDTAKKLLKKQAYDLIITAAMLPKFHGFDLSKFVASNYPATKIIVMSSVYKGLEYRNQAISEFGADDFIEKPVNDKEFKDSVYSLINISESDIQNQYDSGSTQVPTSDTKKIKILKEEEGGQLSSNDIFGDIIDKVEHEPSLSINLDDETDDPVKESVQKEKPGTTQILDKDYMMGKTNIESAPKKTSNEKEIDFNALIKSGEPGISTDSGRNIEADISKKLEETLSGLGIEPKSKKASARPSEPRVEAAPEQKKPEPVKEEKGEEIEGYEILDMIARGGMAEIYKAKKKGVKGFEKVIVIKKILSGYGEDDKYIEMFVDEAKIAAELTHPNIVQIYDFGKKDNFYFIAMEYVEGRDLRLILNKLIERDIKLEEHLGIHLVIKTLEALSYAHSAKDSKGNNLDIVHRDISPPNILVSYSGEVKLTDFGVSKASNKSHQTLSGALKGKLLYMSPEQAKAEKNIDNRSDIYSVGVILFELVTGKKLFSGSSEMDVLNKVQEGKIIKPSELKPNIDQELENIILRAITLDKSMRYRNATEMITALENYLYINYNHIPTPVHLQHKMYNLFKDDILKSGIIVNQKPEPYEIEKIIPPQTVESIEEVPEVIEEQKEVIELTEESKISEPSDISEINDEMPDFEEEPQKPVTDIPQENITGPDETVIQPDATIINPKTESDLDELIISDSRFEDKKKTRPVFKILLLVSLIVFSIWYLFIKENGLFAPSDKISGENKKVVDSSQKNIITPPVNKVESEDGTTTDDGDNSENQAGTEDSTGIIQNGPDTVEQPVSGEDLVNQKEEEDKKIEEEKQRLKDEELMKEKKRLRKIEADKRRKKAAEDKKRKEEEELKNKEEEEFARKAEEERLRKAKEEEDKKALELKKKKEEEERNRIKPGQLVSLPEADVKPVAVSTPAPKLARSQKLRQSVIVMALIGHTGNVEKVRILRKSRSKKIDLVITQAIMKWKYKPAEKDGVKVKVWKTINLQ
ncbi:MAG: protein kinase [Acidobacteriota bacterium]